MSSHVPIEIITNILSRLPVKSLLRFRCVSKPWCSLIKEPHFIKLHLDHQIQTSVPNVMMEHVLLFSITPSSDSPVHVAKEMNYPHKTRSYIGQILGSCNGLLCVKPKKDVLFIWNPSTQEFNILPRLPTDALEPSSYRSIYHGFGYDECSNDYKVVRIAEFHHIRNLDMEYEILIYSLRTNCWRRMVQDAAFAISGNMVSGVLVNGGLHWAATREVVCTPFDDYVNMIVSFDLAEERFKVVPLPDHEKDEFHMHMEVLGGRLCVIDNFHCSDILQVWMMMDYGVKESWTKLFSYSGQFSSKPYHHLKPSCKVLLERDDKDIVLYDSNSKKVRTFDNRHLWKWCTSVIYVQSLVSPNVSPNVASCDLV